MSSAADRWRSTLTISCRESGGSEERTRLGCSIEPLRDARTRTSREERSLNSTLGTTVSPFKDSSAFQEPEYAIVPPVTVSSRPCSSMRPPRRTSSRPERCGFPEIASGGDASRGFEAPEAALDGDRPSEVDRHVEGHVAQDVRRGGGRGRRAERLPDGGVELVDPSLDGDVPGEDRDRRAGPRA